MFTDGYSDLDPSCFGPVWSMLDHTTVISKPMEDSLNKAYSNFIYLPSQFSHLNQNHQVLMTELTCSDHHNTVLKDKLSALISRKGLNTEHVSSLCQPLPKHFLLYGPRDNHFSKVPRTNATERGSMSSGSMLQCLTLLKTMTNPSCTMGKR